MLKRLLITLAFITSGVVFADVQTDVNGDVVTSPKDHSPVVQPVETPQKQVVNPNNVGSTAGSNQIFGNPPVTGQKGQKYYTKEQLSNGQNSSDVGSKVGSNQVFGNPPVTGQKGQEYYTQDELANPINNPNAPSSSKYGIDNSHQ